MQINFLKAKKNITLGLRFYLCILIFTNISLLAANKFEHQTESLAIENDGDLQNLNQAIIRHLEKTDRSKNKNKVYYFDKKPVSAPLVEASLLTLKKILKHAKTSIQVSQLINKYFDIYKVNKEVLITGYYIPVLEASKYPDEKYAYPIYKKPSSNKMAKAYDRKDIDGNMLLSGLGLELAYTDDQLKLFFMHIQGSGILQFQDGSTFFANNDGTNDKNYKSILRDLLNDKKIKSTNRSIFDEAKDYFKKNPEDISKYLHRNKRYVYFKSSDDGPYGLGLYKLTAQRSIATDKNIFPAGGIAYLKTKIPILDENGYLKNWQDSGRLYIDQDTGTAIKGYGRVDLYFGEGDQAGRMAEYMHKKGELYYLLLKER
ncbi:MAG: MltA domain-containing protein [Pseudomonadota bacterium]